jgi:hypothetical protein
MRYSATSRLAVFSFVSIIATASFSAYAGAPPAPVPSSAQSAQPAPTPQPKAPTVDDIADACFSAAERAQPLLRQKRFREGRALLEICARDACPHSARSDCREWLAETIDAQSSVIVSAHEVRGDGDTRMVVDIHGVRAVIDDALVVDNADKTSISIDPGRHRLRVERPGVDPVVQDIDVREGEKSRVVDVYWHVADIAPSRPVPASVYVTGAIGLVTIGVGTYFEIAGFSERHTLDTSCRAARSCSQAQVDFARTQIGVGDAAIGGGLLFLTSAAILYFTRPDAPRAPEQAQETAWRLEVTTLGLSKSLFAGVRRAW